MKHLPLVALLAASMAGANPGLVLDQPQPGTHQAGIKTIHGWVCGGGSVEIAIGEATFSLTADAPRWDVALAFPECGPSVGFAFAYNYGHLKPGVQAITLTANGQTLTRDFYAVSWGDDFVDVVDIDAATFAHGFDGTFWINGAVVNGAPTNILFGWDPSTQGFVERFIEL